MLLHSIPYFVQQGKAFPSRRESVIGHGGRPSMRRMAQKELSFAYILISMRKVQPFV